MSSIIRAASFFILVISIGNNQSDASDKCHQFGDHVDQYHRAINNEKFLPQVQIQSNEKAYLVQACVLKTKLDEAIGFKAGLTNEAAQKRFQADKPVMGVLTEKNIALRKKVHVGNRVALIEAELVFRLKQDIDNQEDLNREIQELVDGVALAIEVPLFHFERIDVLVVNDIIASNVGAYRFVIGDFVKLDKIDFNSIKLNISKNGEPIINKINVNVKDKWEALKWLVKKSYLEGYDLKKGTIYLTGSLNSPMIAEKAKYQVTASEIGAISLVVK